MCPVLLLVAVIVVDVARGAESQCWDHPVCQEVNSERSMMVNAHTLRLNQSCETAGQEELRINSEK